MKFEYREIGDGFLVSLSYGKQKTTRQFIIDLISLEPSITRDLLAEKIGVSSDTIKQHLANLKREGFIKRTGGRKDGLWELILPDKNE